MSLGCFDTETLVWRPVKRRLNVVDNREVGGVISLVGAAEIIQVRLYGTITLADGEDYTFAFADNLQALNILEEPLFCQHTGFTDFFGYLRKVRARKLEGENKAVCYAVLEWVGTVATHIRGFDLETLSEEANDWGI